MSSPRPPLSPTPGEPFDRAARRQQVARVQPGFDFLSRALAADLSARVTAADRRFDVAVDLGGTGITGDALTIRIDAAMRTPADRATGTSGGRDSAADARAAPPRVKSIDIVADADRLPIADASVDLIAAFGLHAVGDLPGALILARRALRPGGLFVAAVVGGATLAEVRADFLAAEVAVTGRAAPRVLPMVDPTAAPGLLQRAGFVDPVAEVDTLTIRYDDLASVLRDLRGAGEGNILHGREPLRRDVLADAAARFAARAIDGRIAVTVQVITLTGRGR